MGCVRKRRGKWVVDYYDLGRRRWKTCATKREAEDFLTKMRRKAAEATVPLDIDPRITVKEFAPVFLDRCRARGARESTLVRYRSCLAHIVDSGGLGDLEVRAVDRPRVEQLLTRKLAEVGSRQGQKGPEAAGRRTLKRSSVALLLRILSNMMAAAVAKQIVAANPLGGLSRELRLGMRRKGDKVKALSPEQLAKLLAATETEPEYSWAFWVMAGAGLRVGEAMGLAWDRHVDLAARVLHVEEQVAGPLKDSEPRDVPMTFGVVAVLTALRARQRAAALAAGRDMQDHLIQVFDGDHGERAQARIIRRLRRRLVWALRAAGLPAHHTLHSLRHSFASIHISRGVSIAAVRQWLGHSTIALTVDLYGSWLPTEAGVLEIPPVAESSRNGSSLSGGDRAKS